jgi:hypothetical protein
MRKFFSVALLAFTLTQAKAQVSKNLRDSTVVVIFNGSGTTSNSPKKKKTGEDNIVKIAPLGFITGTFPVFYERKINDFFSVQLGAGFTGLNYLRNAINKDNVLSDIPITYPWGDDPSKSDAVEGLYSYNYRKAGMGYMFSIQPRLYFESDALDGSFMAISFDHYHYTSSIPGVSVDGNGDVVYTGSPQNEFENINDLMVHFGDQAVYDRLTLEYTTGIGLRNVSGSKYVANFDGSNITDQGFGTYKQTVFNFSIGLRVGYHF